MRELQLRTNLPLTKEVRLITMARTDSIPSRHDRQLHLVELTRASISIVAQQCQMPGGPLLEITGKEILLHQVGRA